METVTRQQALIDGSTHYFTGKPCKRGHTSKRNVNDASCVECSRLRSKATRDSDPDGARRSCVEAELRLKQTNYPLWQQKRAKWRHDVKLKHGPIKYMIGIVRDSAKKRGIEFNITRDDIIIPDTCPMLGIPLFNTPGKATDNTPSLDRIDNNRGYVKDNIHVISWRANKIKSNSTVEELELIAKYLRSLQV